MGKKDHHPQEAQSRNTQTFPFRLLVNVPQTAAPLPPVLRPVAITLRFARNEIPLLGHELAFVVLY